ncbi:MAG: hypothetical protein ACOYL5_15100 [Phototrophicaceae bacterium]
MKRLLQWLSTPLHFFCASVALALYIVFVAVVVRYREPIPFIDTVELNAVFALDVVEGSFQWGDVFTLFNGHRVIGTVLPTLFFARFTAWDLTAESNWVILVGTFSTLLLLGLFAKNHPTLAHFALVPFTVLMLSLHSLETWIIVNYGFWQTGIAFALLTLMLIALRPRNRLTVVLAIATSILAMFSATLGLTAWVGGTILLGLKGYRWGLLAYLLVGVGVVVASSGSLISGSAPISDIPQWQLELPNIPFFLSFIVLYIGSPVSAFQIPLAWVGATAVLAAIAGCSVYLWRVGQFRSAQVWLALAAMGLTCGGLIALGRTQWGLENALRARYTYTGNLLWVAAVALTIITLAHAHTHARHWVVNVGLAWLVLAGVGHGITLAKSVTYIFEDLQPEGKQVSIEVLRPLYRCLAEYPLMHDASCIHDSLPDFPYGKTIAIADRLALHRLAEYAKRPTTPIFTPHTMDDVVIIESRSVWRAAHIQNFLVPSGMRVMLLVPPSEQSIADGFPIAIEAYSSRSALEAQLPAAANVWRIAENRQVGLDGYALRTQVGAPYDLFVGDYRRALPLAETPLVYEGLFQLEGWQFPTSLTVAACDSVALETNWRLRRATQDYYKMSFVLVNEQGNGIARDDRAPNIQTQHWQVGQPYQLEQQLQVPCDLPAGTYAMLMGVYSESDTTSIIALGQTQYITSLVVSGS